MTTTPEPVKPEPTDSVILSTSKDALRGIFRIITGRPNTLTEIYPRPILVSIKDIAELHKQIAEKLSRYELFGAEFSAVVSYESNRNEEYGSWESFFNNEWSIPEVTDSLVLKWDFLIQFHKAPKPANHTITIRLASDRNPFHLMQAVFSKDPEELDRYALESAPMSCRVDFDDNILSQELLAMVSRWNASRRTPEIILPILEKVNKRADKIRSGIKYSLPLICAVVCFAYYWNQYYNIDPSAVATAGLIRNTVLWLVASSAAVFFTYLLARWLSVFSYLHIQRFGRFTIFEITRGDENKQNKLAAKSRNSMWKFAASTIFALVWNIVGGIITALILKD